MGHSTNSRSILAVVCVRVGGGVISVRQFESPSGYMYLSPLLFPRLLLQARGQGVDVSYHLSLCHAIACFACNFTHSQIYLISLSTDKSARTLIDWAVGHVMCVLSTPKAQNSRSLSPLRLQLNFACGTDTRIACLSSAMVYVLKLSFISDYIARKWSWPNMPHYARRA
jgi:hypothetical protein